VALPDRLVDDQTADAADAADDEHVGRFIAHVVTTSSFVLILIFAAAVSLSLSQWVDAGIILAIVML